MSITQDLEHRLGREPTGEEIAYAEMRQLRDQYLWRAESELKVRGATPKFHALMRSYHVLSSEVGYPGDPDIDPMDPYYDNEGWQ